MTDDCTDCPDDFAAVTAENEAEPDTAPDPRGTKVTRWGPTLLAPIGKRTGDGRRFAAGALSNRDLPLGLKWQRSDGSGHSGSVVVGTLDGVVYDDEGAPHGFGLLFNPDPEQLPRLAEDTAEARMLLEQGATGPSVDLDDMEFHALDDGTGDYAADPTKRPEIEVTRGRISAVTLVPIPAFAEAGAGKVPLTDMEPGEYQDYLAAHNAALTASVRTSGWSDLPVADVPWDAPAAARRLHDWAGGDHDLLEQAFLWHNADRPGDLRFPIADVLDDQLVLVPGALATASAVLAGHNGGSVLPDADQQAMRETLARLNFQLEQEDAEVAEALAHFSDQGEMAELVGLSDALGSAPTGHEQYGARFEALKAKLAAKGIANPDALAAKIGRRKYGAKGFQRLRAGVAAKKVKPLHGARTASALVEEAMVAAAALNEASEAPLPAEWFADPKLGAPTPLTVTPDGRVFGHLATWGTCHTGLPGCTVAPKSRSRYAYFHTGAIDTTEGELPVGRISMGGGHADTRVGFQAAVEHYDSTSSQAAVVRAGEDKYGIWVAGAALPGTDTAQLKRSPLSGDWRRIGGNLELVHALAVNSPGFPVPRSSMVAGAQQALVAAGVLALDGTEPDRATFTAEEVSALVVRTVHETRRAEANFARAMSALGAMDDADDRSTTAKRKLRAARAARAVTKPRRSLADQVMGGY